MDLHESHSSARHDDASVSGSAVASLAHGEGQTDEELIQRVRVADDAAAFESLVHRYERELFSYLRRYLGSADVNFQWTPSYGKVSLLGKRIVHTDLYLSVGGGITLEQSLIPSDNNADGDGNDPATYPTIIVPSIPIAIGSHVFLSQSSALRFELRDTMLIEHRVQSDTTWFRQSLGVSAGIVFYGKAKN